jgi:serine/threonine-protein kinase
MGDDSSSDVAAAAMEDDDPSVTAVADEPAVTRDRAPEVKPGDLLGGRYQIEAVIGKGGSGVVLRAYDRVSATVIAVKVLKPGLSHDPRWEKRFQRELRLGRPIRHPNVCRIFDIADDADGYRFLTMEYATGGTLRDLIKKNDPLRPLQDRIADAAFVIAGLAAIHDAGIVHRDVKPDNVLRMDDGRLVLSDFGLATDLPDSTMVSVFVGTPHYMAPEVREGDPATTRSDVWSLGVVLHELFFGKRPERRSARSMSGASKSSVASTSSIVERAMLALCTRCLADDPSERPEDARAVHKLFESARRSPYAMIRTARRWPLFLSAAIGTALLIGFGVRSYRRSHTPIAEHAATIQRLNPTGEPKDWRNSAHTVATIQGHVHCFSRVDDGTVRVIWGTPRRAEDIAVDSGTRRPAPLLGDTYRVGCPELSPSGRELLFTAQTAAGTAEIRYSTNPVGRDAKPLTAGSEPVWLMSGEEFAYSMDGTNAAVFSLATMRFRLLADPGFAGQQTILGKTASTRSEVLALTVFAKDVQWALVLYEGPGLSQRTSYAIPAARMVRFDSVNDRVFISQQEPLSPLASFDWHAGSYRKIGHHGEVDLVDVVIGGESAALLGRRRTKDVWFFDAGGRKRLTSDGGNFAAAISTTGDLLLARSGPAGAVNIWSRSTDGTLKKLTNGQFDTSPDYSSDGKSWVYVDYPQKSLMLCVTATNECRVLQRDELLPTLPTISPDGTKVAYVRQLPAPRLIVLSIRDQKDWPMGDTHWKCPPVWSSPTQVWGFEGSPGHYSWAERDIERRQRTGRRIEVANYQSDVNDDAECWPENVDVTSPVFRKIRVEAEETSSILRLPRSQLD